MSEGNGGGNDELSKLRSQLEEERRRVSALERSLAECREAGEAATKELDLLCYAISHDLRAPLRAIDGFSEALAEDCAEEVGEDGQQYLGRLRAACRRMVQMVDGILELSRLARDPLERQNLDLSALARTVADQLAEREPERNVRVTIADGIGAEGDARLLRLVLEALLDNAWKYTGKLSQANVEFGVADCEDGSAYFVRDDGAGFDMSFAGKLFTPFQRLHAPSEFEGLGIGLARVQRIVQRHGGRAWADAKPDEGATFSFTLGRQTEDP